MKDFILNIMLTLITILDEHVEVRVALTLLMFFIGWGIANMLWH